MLSVPRLLHHFVQLVWTLLALLGNTTRFWLLCLRPSAALAAENLFLRKQLALYQERHIKPQRALTPPAFPLVWLARWFDWRQALAVVQPRPLSAGIARGSGCSGGGSRSLDDHRSLRTCKRSSAAWPVTTRPGAKSALPTNCC